MILRRTLLVALLLGCPTLGWSHESRPVYVEISEVRTDVFSVHWKVPTSLPASNIPEPVLPSDCVRDGEFFALDSADAYLRRQLYRCPGGLANRKVGIEFPAANPSVSCLFRVSRLSGESFTKLLNPGETSWVIPEQETRLRVAGEYTYLGILHILEGIDHLLFLVCLLIVAATWRRIHFAVIRVRFRLWPLPQSTGTQATLARGGFGWRNEVRTPARKPPLPLCDVRVSVFVGRIFTILILQLPQKKIPVAT